MGTLQEYGAANGAVLFLEHTSVATIVERTNPSGKTVFRVQYRLSGEKSVSKTFPTKKMAREFVTTIDAKIIQDKHNALLGVTNVRFKDVMGRYLEEVQAHKRSEQTR